MFAKKAIKKFGDKEKSSTFAPAIESDASW